MPLVVMARGEPEPQPDLLPPGMSADTMAALNRAGPQAQADFSASVPGADLITVPGTTHYIQTQRTRHRHRGYPTGDRPNRHPKQTISSMIDLRSDTVTRPTEAMRAAMAAAEVGDDQYGEDPTTNQLQSRLAEMLGKAAAVWLPSGTMANQVALRVLTRPGDEVIFGA